MIPFQAGQPLKAAELNYNFGQAQAGSFIPGAGSLGHFSGAGFSPAPVPHIPTSSAVRLQFGIVRRICNQACSTYEVELVNRSFDEDCGGTGTGTGSGSE